MTKLHPMGIESRYSLDMACYLLQKQQPHSVQVCSDDVELVQAVARRLSWLDGSLVVNNSEIAQAVSGILGIRPVVGEIKADAALVPFCNPAEFVAPTTNYLVVVSFNALSYKSILYPGSIRGNVFQLLRQLRQNFAIDERIGLFTPRFLFPWLVSALAGVRFPALHFRTEQIAMDHLFAPGWSWWTGYIIVISGHQHS